MAANWSTTDENGALFHHLASKPKFAEERQLISFPRSRLLSSEVGILAREVCRANIPALCHTRSTP